MIVVRVSFVEELLRYLLMISVGGPVMILRRGRKIVILTELGGQPLVFLSKIPSAHDREVRDIYEALRHGRYVYLDERGKLIISDEPPPPSRSFGAVGMFLDVSGVYLGEDGFRVFSEFLKKPS